jgi:molecular chaperone DnaK
MSNLTAIGIDLGTTYSVMSWVDENGKAEVIPNANSERLTASAVFFDDDTIIVGQDAKDRSVDYPDKVILFIKRQIKNRSFYIHHKGRAYYPVDISSLILRKLKQDAEQHLGKPVTHAVITVPAYFDEEARRLTQEAGKLAGLNILGVINEPTAAAIAYSLDTQPRDEHVLVYDLGGGTFDVTILHVHNQGIQVLASKGDHSLGGKDFDDKLISEAVKAFQQQHGFDPTSDPNDANDLRARAEDCKRELSQRTKSRLKIRSQGYHSELHITREQFEAWIRGRLETARAIIDMTLQEAKMSPQQIDRILLVGGSSRIPLIASIIKEQFGRDPEPFSAVNPNEAVSLGAAILAAKKMLEVKPEEVPLPVANVVGGLEITDVLSQSFGVAATAPGSQEQQHSIIIRRNTPLPARDSREYVTNLPGQTAIQIQVYQGESKNLALCNPVGNFMLSGLPPGRPAGQKIRITFSCDTDGIMHVTANDILSGVEAQTEIKYTVGRTENQVAARRRWLDQDNVE